MPMNWPLLLRILAAVLHALATLPADFDHRDLADAAAELLKGCVGSSPPEPE